MKILKVFGVLAMAGLLTAGCIDPNTGRLMGMDSSTPKTAAPAQDPGQGAPNGQSDTGQAQPAAEK